MFITQEQFDSLNSFLNTHDEFIIVGHKEPDGDCLASCLAMSSMLKKLKKTHQLLSSGPFKRTEIKRYEKYFSNHIASNTGIYGKVGVLMLDCSESHRLGYIADEILNYDTFIIDHHQTSNADDNFSIINSNAPAAAYLVQLIYEHFIGQPDKHTAEILLLGMCTDTGFFKFLDEKSTTVFLAVSRLVERGANPKHIFTQISSGKPFSTRKLLSVMLERAQLKFNNRLIYTYETLEDTAKYGKNGRDSDTLYSLLLSVEKVQAVLFIRQDTPTTCTAGLRSQENIDVSKIASKFGGGGHKCAAGLSIEGKIEDILPKILQEFQNIFENK